MDSAGSPRILLVDDHVDGVDALGDLFATLGWTVDRAYSGAEALTLAAAVPPNVVIVDINMPNMDGYETARRLHEMVSAQLRIVGYSGSAVRPLTRLPANQHIECIVSKGAPIDLLIDVVDASRRDS